MTTEALKIDNLTSGYGTRKVLKDVSLTISEGSLIKSLSGLINTWSGQVYFKNVAIDNSLEAHDRVKQGLIQIPQGDLIFPDMTVEENLLVGGYLVNDHDELQRRLERVYKLFDRLLERQNQVARTLSGGERRMLSIGRGLMSDGYLMMLDEPSLGLAPKLIDQVYEVIANLREISPSLLVVEENPARLQEIADWIYLMDDGEFVWNGSSKDLKDNEDILSTYLGV